MFSEEAYGSAWKALASSEGHKRKAPNNPPTPEQKKLISRGGSVARGLILEALEGGEELSAQELSDLTDRSYDTCKKILKTLCEDEGIEKVKRGRRVHYVMKPKC